MFKLIREMSYVEIEQLQQTGTAQPGAAAGVAKLLALMDAGGESQQAVMGSLLGLSLDESKGFFVVNLIAGDPRVSNDFWRTTNTGCHKWKSTGSRFQQDSS